MAADIPTTEPLFARAGDTWKWTRTLEDYPASSGWTLKYRFKNADGGFEIVATASGSDHSVTVAAATSAAYAAGKYSWVAWVEGGSSEKYTVDSGSFTVQSDYRAIAAATGLDDRSHARKVLTAIEAVIERRATKDQEEYTIEGRSLKRTPIPDLLKLRQKYQAEVVAEEAAAKLAAGQLPGRKIQFRF
jgi:hypothetical protein